MKIEITTSAENVEMANMLLKQAYDAAIELEGFRKQFDVSKKDLEKAERFRKAL